MDNCNNLEIIWPSEKTYNLVLFESIIEFQKKKYELFKSRFRQKYQKNKYCDSLKVKFFESFESFDFSLHEQGFLVACVAGISEHESSYTLDLMDEHNLKTVTIDKQNCKQDQPIVQGIYLGLHIRRQEKTNLSDKHNLKQLYQEDKGSHFSLIDYHLLGIEFIDWAPSSDSKVVVVSDVHVGSLTFCKENFVSLLIKINQDPKIKYFLINGDLVDGCEVYPNHQKDLYSFTFENQYTQAAQLLSILRPDITVLFAPGNHDFSGRIEPQYVPQKIKNIFRKYRPNVLFGPNPGYYLIDGIYFYLTHGTSYNSILNKLSMDYQKCAQVSQYLWKVGDISPIKKGVPVVPNIHMNHVIPDKVNVICSGHIHSQQVIADKNYLLVATGAWQHLTPYMELIGLKPSISTCVVINLKDPQKYEEWDLKDETTKTHTYQNAALFN